MIKATPFGKRQQAENPRFFPSKLRRCLRALTTGGRSRSRNSITVTSAPRFLHTEPSSKPMTPPPITASFPGTRGRLRAPGEEAKNGEQKQQTRVIQTDTNAEEEAWSINTRSSMPRLPWPSSLAGCAQTQYRSLSQKSFPSFFFFFSFLLPPRSLSRPRTSTCFSGHMHKLRERVQRDGIEAARESRGMRVEGN